MPITAPKAAPPTPDAPPATLLTDFSITSRLEILPREYCTIACVVSAITKATAIGAAPRTAPCATSFAVCLTVVTVAVFTTSTAAEGQMHGA